MKTVFICMDWFHPAYKAGGPVQSVANLVAQYKGDQLNFKIFCSSVDLDGTVNVGVAFDQWVYYNPNTQVWYASAKKLSAAIIKREIKNAKADVLFVIGIYSWYFNIIPLLLTRVPVKIMSVRGMLHPGALSQKSFKKNIYLAFWRATRLYKKYIFHATDDREKDFVLQALGNKATVFVAGNYPRVFALQTAAHKKAGTLTLMSVALISPMKNIALVLQALQDCQRQVVYHIYGPVKDDRYWQECLALVNKLPANIEISYKGDLVPTKIEAALEACEVFILPSKSENFGHALFEALSAGKPVITSHNTPFNNLQEQLAGENVSLKNTLELTKAIDFFAAMEPAEFSRWNNAAHSYAVRHNDMDLLTLQYDKMFLQGYRRKNI